MTSNPLLQKSTLPNQAPYFDKIKTEHYLPAVEEAIETARAKIEEIKSNKDVPTFENTIVALESSSEDLGQAASVFYNQLSAMGGDDLHALVAQIGPMSAKFSSDIMLDEDLFARVKAVYDQRASLDLTAEQDTLLDDTYRGFVRSGALLDDKKKARLREISEQLSMLNPAFMQNTVKSAEAFEMVIDNEKDLAGLPESAKDSAADAAKEAGYDGKWLFTLDYPSFGPFMQYADNRALREKVWRAFTNRAYGDEFDNCENIKTIISLRKERANLLGHDTHAHYVLEERMAKTPDTVFEFLEKLKKAYKPAAQEDLKMLTEFAKDEHGVEDLKPWDIGYYAEKLKQKLFKFTSEDFRPYYQLDKVLDGCFNHFSKLFNLKFVLTDKYPTWHEDVKVFEVFNTEDDSFVGTLYGDFHPRKGKNQGAWKTSYRDQGLFRGKIERPIVAIVCNFTKPTSSRPSLLTHDEVTTLFHEMGHAVHALLSNVTYRSLAGTSVLWDFVELPSQLQENWCYEKDMLDDFAVHYETGEKIPSELVEKLVKSMHFMVGWAGLRQIGLGTLDMAWHTTDPSKVKDIAAFEEEATKDTSLFPRLGGPSSTSFGHIFAGGYSAGYYSYKWAEVLDADTFELFKEKGLYDTETAKSYKDNILSKGGSEQPDILYKRFRGRDADPDALLRREGLLDKKAA
ncbi:MAG: M3 family peptidase [Alphaproteobacteria bacterium]|nr:M3 family peptidase [Alphaproteobacteria bacterium]